MDRLGVQAFRHLCEIRGKFGKGSLHVKILSRACESQTAFRALAIFL
jgi:hypothetical protein